MILVNDPGSWDAVYAPLLHAEWHGWTFTDTIFPFFLWIAGVSLTLSFAARMARGDSRVTLLAHAVKRSALLFLIGLFLNAFPRFDFAALRIPGVLQRIAICYVLAAAIFLFTTSAWSRIAWIAGLLAAYWILIMQVGGGVLDVEGNFAQKVDQALLTGHMWSQTRTWDPEGIVNTIPAIATVLFGILAGQLLRQPMSPERKAAWMFFAGNCLICAGLVISQWMPVNKKLWTVSFAVSMAGLAWVTFAAWYWLVDVEGWRSWSLPFAIYGLNAITIYMLAGLLADVLGVTGAHAWLWQHVYSPLAPAKFASLLFALTYVLVFFKKLPQRGIAGCQPLQQVSGVVRGKHTDRTDEAKEVDRERRRSILIPAQRPYLARGECKGRMNAKPDRFVSGLRGPTYRIILRQPLLQEAHELKEFKSRRLLRQLPPNRNG